MPSAGEDMEQSEHSYRWWKGKMVQRLWKKTVWQFLIKVNIGG